MSDRDHLDASLRTIAKGAGVSFIGAFIGLGLGYFSRIIIARWLGAEDYGLISLGYAALMIGATLSLVGLPAGIQRYVSFYKGKGDKGRIKGTILGALKISVPMSLIVGSIFFFYADWISIHVFHSPELTPILKIFAIAIPFLVLTDNAIYATIGFQDVRYRVYVVDLFQNIFKLLAIVALLVLGFGVMGAAWGWVLAIVLTPFLAFYFLEKRVFPIFNAKVKAIFIDRELFSFSLPLIFTMVAGMVIGWMDVLMLGYFLSASAVGIYNAALPTARLVMVATKSISVLFVPVASELYAKNRVQELRGIYTVITKWVLSLALPVFLLMVLFSESIIRIMFGAEYVEGATALSILAFAFFFSSVISPAVFLLQVYGKTKLIMVVYFVAAGVNFTLNLLLIPRYGINGAAITTALQSLLGIIYLFAVYRIGGMQPFRLNQLKPVFASIIAVLVVYVATKYIVGESLIALITMLFVFIILYFFLLLIFKSFEEEDLMIMRAIDERLGTKSDWLRKIIGKFV